MTKILAFDTTNEFMSVAILEDSKILAYKFINEVGKQSQLLIPTIEELLKKLNIWYSDLDALALTIGPGSFAGVRVGMSVAKGIKIATDLRIICITSFEALAFPYYSDNAESNKQKLTGNSKIAVVMDARQGNLFVQLFNANGSVVTEQKIIKQDEITDFVRKSLSSSNDKNSELLLVGSGKNIAKEVLTEDFKPAVGESLNVNTSKNDDLLDAKNIALLGYEKYNKSEFCKDIKPLYLRPPRVCRKEKKNNLINIKL